MRSFLAESPRKLLPDCRPPGQSRGNKTLRDCQNRLALIVSRRPLRRGEKRSELGWHSDILVAVQAAPQGAFRPIVVSSQEVALR
jgi:hypothetical protein